MKYIITLRETTVRRFIVESDKTEPNEIEEQFWEEDQDALPNPGGCNYQDEYNSEIQHIEPMAEA